MMVVENGGSSDSLYVAYHSNDTLTTFENFKKRLARPGAIYYWYRANYPDGK
jgi:hypothetical protein